MQPNSGKAHLLFATACWVLCASFISAQQPSPLSAEKAPQATKKLAFEVISIRPSGPNSQIDGELLPNGYHVTGVLLIDIIANAYFPVPALHFRDQIKGYPSWVTSERYDIDAKVSPEDAAEWDNLISTRHLEMMQAMLQSLLAERCKLLIHQVPTEVDGHIIIAGRHGPKLDSAKPFEDPPNAMKFSDGGIAVGSEPGKPIAWTFHHATVESLRSFLSIFVHGPVENRTGLTGTYDFVLSHRPEVPHATAENPAPEPQDLWNFDALGLQIRPAKLPSQMLIIDHIEHPSEN